MYVRETVFQELLLALWTSIHVDHVRDGLPTLVGVDVINFTVQDTSYNDFRLGVYSLLSFTTVETGDQLIASAKVDVESLRKVCRQDKDRERKLTEKGIDNDIPTLVDQLRKATDLSLSSSQIDNSQGCGFLLTALAKTTSLVSVCLCLTSRVLLSPFLPLIVAVNLG